MNGVFSTAYLKSLPRQSKHTFTSVSCLLRASKHPVSEIDKCDWQPLKLKPDIARHRINGEAISQSIKSSINRFIKHMYTDVFKHLKIDATLSVRTEALANLHTSLCAPPVSVTVYPAVGPCAPMIRLQPMPKKHIRVLF